MSQRDVADAMAARGFSSWIQTTTAKVEAAQRPLRVNEFVAVCSIFGVDPAELISEVQASGDAVLAEAMAEIRTRRLELMRARASLDAAQQEAKRAEKAVQRAQARLHEASARRVSLAQGAGAAPPGPATARPRQGLHGVNS